MLAWEKESREASLGKPKGAKTVDLTGGKSKSTVPDGVIATMTSLSKSMIEHQKATLKKQEEKDDARMKSWRRLPTPEKRNPSGGVEEDGTLPTAATEEMLAILGCQNGTQVEYLCQSMSSYNMSLEPGFCTALNKGILVNQDDALTRKILPFF